jgi:plastocyanin
MIARVMWLMAGSVGLAGCSEPSAPPALTVVADPASDGQTGVVGAALAVPLRVQVMADGVPRAGLTLRWRARGGTLTPTESTTDGNGYSEATWMMGTAARFDTATATVDGVATASAAFSALAVPGPPVAIHAAGGSGQTLAVNHPRFAPLIAVVSDRYGNPVEGLPVTWTVESGPVVFLTPGAATEAVGQSACVLGPSGATGDAVVRAALPGGGTSTDFPLTVGPAMPWAVNIIYTGQEYAFASGQNGSRNPAVDTIPVGASVEWSVAEFDYDNHGVASVGAPAFQGGDLPFYGPYKLVVKFTAPGTYHYEDPYHREATGTVVVE